MVYFQPNSQKEPFKPCFCSEPSNDFPGGLGSSHFPPPSELTRQRPCPYHSIHTEAAGNAKREKHAEKPGEGRRRRQRRGCARSEPVGARWDSSGNGGSASALGPEVTENKTLIPLKGTSTGDTSRDTSQPRSWGMCPKFFHP